MQDWKYRHHITGGGKCGTGIIGTKLQGVENAGPRSYGTPKHLVVAAHKKSSVQLFVGSTNVVTVFQYYDSVSDRLEPYGYEMCVNLISFCVQCYGLQSVKRNTLNTQTYMAQKHVQ